MALFLGGGAAAAYAGDRRRPSSVDRPCPARQAALSAKSTGHWRGASVLLGQRQATVSTAGGRARGVVRCSYGEAFAGICQRDVCATCVVGSVLFEASLLGHYQRVISHTCLLADSECPLSRSRPFSPAEPLRWWVHSSGSGPSTSSPREASSSKN